MNKRLLVLVLLVFLLLFNLSTISFAEKNITFKDVEKDDWYYRYVNDLVKKELIKGYDGNIFRPNEDISWAEFLKIALISSTGEDLPMIQDVHWGMTYFQKAKEMKIIDGSSIKYNSLEELNHIFNSPILREDMAEIINNISKIILGEEDKDEEIYIGDKNDISIDKRNDVKNLYLKGIIKGKKNGFDPKGNLTRAEASTLIIRLIEKDKRIESSNY